VSRCVALLLARAVSVAVCRRVVVSGPPDLRWLATACHSSLYSTSLLGHKQKNLYSLQWLRLQARTVYSILWLSVEMEMGISSLRERFVNHALHVLIVQSQKYRMSTLWVCSSKTNEKANIGQSQSTPARAWLVCFHIVGYLLYSAPSRELRASWRTDRPIAYDCWHAVVHG